MARAIGIDLGTTYTLVATLQDGRPAIVPNAQGQRLTPSVVAFMEDGEPLVGQAARGQAILRPDRTVFSIKRRMGSEYRVKAGEMSYSPQEVSSFILRKVKEDAQRYLGEEIKRAVISVPAYFNDRQRQATREAGAMAGLEVMRIINEPTAAALAYGLQREEAHTVLVWDLGGGTFDVSILELGEGIFEVRAVSGDTWLGGDDWDARIVDYFMEEYRRASQADFPKDLAARQQLKEMAERAKRELSTLFVSQERISLPAPAGTNPLELRLTRERLEDLTQDLLGRMVVPTEQAMRDAGLSAEEIDRVILVGGATRMPAVRRLARDLFRKEPYRSIHPDEVVALGAAIHAGMLLGMVDRAVLLDVLPLSLGVETWGGVVSRLIARNSPLPARGARLFTTAADYQTSMEVHLLQGERARASDNVSLGRFQLTDIPAAARGLPKVEVSLEVDGDGIVQVSAEELLSGSQVKVAVASSKFLDPGEVERMVEEAERGAAQDGETRERVRAGIEARNLRAVAEMVEEQAGRHGGTQVQAGAGISASRDSGSLGVPQR